MSLYFSLEWNIGTLSLVSLSLAVKRDSKFARFILAAELQGTSVIGQANKDDERARWEQ